MPYFRYSFLNGLRDELYLTQTRQRVTLIALLSLLIPIAGLALGSTWGSGTHRWIKQIVGGGVGCGSGIFAAWLLPRLLWNMLRLFVRKGWFLLPEKAQSEVRPEAAVITLDEFSARSKALEREEFRQIFLFAAVIVGLGLGMERVVNYIDRTKPEVLIQILEGIGMVSFMAGFVLWCMRMKKQLFWKHGLICWACGRKITDAAGLVRVPDRGLCKHCGEEVVSIADSESLARYYAPLTPKDELEKVRRQMWPGAVILFIANAIVTFDVWRLHTNVVEANKAWERISVFLYGHLGFWPALLCGPLLGVVLSLAIVHRIRRLKEQAHADSP